MAEYKLVSKRYLIDQLKLQYGEDLGFQTHVNLTDIADMIEDAPEPDAVAIVRCGRCKFNINGKCRHPKNTVSIVDLSFNRTQKYISVHDDHFCAFGREPSDD